MITCNREVSYIPPGLTRFYQPLDVCINKPFKQAIKEKYIAFCINNGGQKIKVSLTKMIEFICEVWYDNNVITKEMVYNSFRVTGIANNINHSEDHIFASWRKMEEELPIIDNDLEESYQLSIDDYNPNEIPDDDDEDN
jgi:hypothetical protein